MKRRIAFLSAVVSVLSVGALSASGADTPVVQVTPIGRVPFPERGYVIDLPSRAAIDASSVHLTEDGRPIGSFAFSPLRSSGLASAVVLAIDASQSMAGAPAAGALDAARAFVQHRPSNEEIGLISFNNAVHTRRSLTRSSASLEAALATQPALAQGTHIFDAIDHALALLHRTKVSSAAIVILSDGADVGSKLTLEEAASRAKAEHVRVFTVGLRSPAFDSATLSTLARETGASYAEAASAKQLAAIYAALSERLANEYILQYRSNARPHAHVTVGLQIDGVGASASEYTAPTPSRLPPFHKSLVSRFLLSGLSVAFLALLVAGLLGYVVATLLDARRSRLRERINAFTAPSTPEEPGREWKDRTRRAAAASSKHATRLMRSVARDVDIAGIEKSPTTIVWTTVGVTLLAAVVLATIAPIAILFAFGVPFAVRSYLRRRVRQVQNEFAEQLPPNLQVLASALRAGHSFSGALAMTVDHAEEPSRRELRRVIADYQLGVPIDEALRRVSERIGNRDLEQVALVAELQRTTGGNAAEVLDTVVATIRDRADVRRLAKTLTAQGRLARWILTGLPIMTGLGLYAIQPDIMRPMLTTTGGQTALVIAALMVTAGSIVIQRIVDIEV